MRKYAETCKGICDYSSVYNFFIYLLPLKSAVFCGVLFGRILAWEGGTSKTWFLDIAYIEVWMFRSYKTILNLKTRLQNQNLTKILFQKNIFFHYHINLFICSKNKLKIKFIFYRMSSFYRINFFYRLKFFLTDWNFLKRDTNIYFE